VAALPAVQQPNFTDIVEFTQSCRQSGTYRGLSPAGDVWAWDSAKREAHAWGAFGMSAS